MLKEGCTGLKGMIVERMWDQSSVEWRKKKNNLNFLLSVKGTIDSNRRAIGEKRPGEEGKSRGKVSGVICPFRSLASHPQSLWLLFSEIDD